MTDKYRGIVTSTLVEDGSVFCTVEDKDVAGKVHRNAVLQTPLFEQIVVPAVGTEVVVERVNGGVKVVTGFLSSPGNADLDATKLQDGGNSNSSSMVLSFGQRDGASDPETISIEYNDTGYSINADVDGDISLNASGSITLNGIDIEQLAEQVNNHSH